MTGPDFSHCGQPVEWTDQVPLDERFAAAIAVALLQPGVDIELAEWSTDDPLVTEYATWWERQRAAINRHLAATGQTPIGYRLVRARRTDKGDGMVKCYVRLDKARRSIRAVAA